MHIVSSLFMTLALLWLTISTPFVNEAYEIKKEISKQFPVPQSDEDANLFSNTTEEKNPNANSLSEYLHDTQPFEKISIALTKTYKCHSSDLYLDYHGELISPPPEV
ncbi:MAG TPA: hypothetical protein VFS22_00990 [Flavisolibacter sp.]|nr:hypothetical protein [Flavisolibacter sp.]